MPLGYDPGFLGAGLEIPLPVFSEGLEKDVLSAKERPTTDFQDGFYTRYIHFSIATNKDRRQPIVVALNIDQKLRKSARRTDDWEVDGQVGKDYQLDNSYYYKNDYDRGHMAARSAAAWGDTSQEAKEASDATFIYTNACLQHSELNQDEFMHLENWVRELDDDATDRISVFTGPIYTTKSGVQKYIGSPPALIPSAFFKVICFVDKKTKSISTRAFILAQDSDAIDTPRKKRKNFDRFVYQVTTTEVEQQTGLKFVQILKDSNPMKYPEAIPVTSGTMKNNPNDGREPSEFSKVFIISALPNPEGVETGREWISIGNFQPEDINLDGWKISDGDGKEVELQGKIRSGEARRFDKLAPFRLLNRRGTVILTDSQGGVVDRVMYTEKSHKLRAGVPIMFHFDVPKDE